MCTMARGGIHLTDQARVAHESKVSELYVGNVIYPQRTANRMFKYNRRYGVRYKMSQVLAFLGLFGSLLDHPERLMSLTQ